MNDNKTDNKKSSSKKCKCCTESCTDEHNEINYDQYITNGKSIVHKTLFFRQRRDTLCESRSDQRSSNVHSCKHDVHFPRRHDKNNP